MNTKIPTTVQTIRIEKLFEIFDYYINYPTNENVLIITGPNGFGKTQVLNILFNLFNRKFIFFHKLVFEKITVNLSKNVVVEISKVVDKNPIQEEIFDEDNGKTNKEVKKVVFSFFDGSAEVEVFSYFINENMIKNIQRHLPLHQIDKDLWIDHRTDRTMSLDEVMIEYSDHFTTSSGNDIWNIKSKRANEILDSVNVHLIREQRLFKKVVNSEDRRYGGGSRDQTIMMETIQTYSNELRASISERTQKSYVISQSLDSSYPNRLIAEKNTVSKEEYDQKFFEINEKQNKLMKNGLYEKTQKALAYSKDDSKALLVYLNDLEQKLNVFNDLLEKLELFTSILNERRFTFKSIKINRDKGFYFKTTKGKELELNELSSGEQHEVVLLYELIFKTRQGILVLIDEPEISLHITWQKEFLDDLLKIIKIQNFQVLIATHSPSIINDRWDLVYNLEKKEVE